MKNFVTLSILALAVALSLSACGSSSSSSNASASSSADTNAAASSTADTGSSATSSDASSDASSAAPDDATGNAIKALAASVGGDFADQKDKQLGDDPENTVWMSKTQIPTLPCTIVSLKKTNEIMAPCSMKTSSQTAADSAFAAAKASVTGALPSLTAKDVPASSKFVAEALYLNDKTAVLITEQKKPDGQFMVSVSFAKPSFFNT